MLRTAAASFVTAIGVSSVAIGVSSVANVENREETEFGVLKSFIQTFGTSKGTVCVVGQFTQFLAPDPVKKKQKKTETAARDFRTSCKVN